MSDRVRVAKGIKITRREMEISRLKGGGPGGQNKNKRETGIRIKHVPSGLVVMATERRSQGQNLEKAMERLSVKLEHLQHRPKDRKKTKPTRASQQRRLQQKQRNARRKQNRRFSGGD